MLYRVAIQNFGSIRDRQELNLSISGKVDIEQDRQLAGPYQIRTPRVSVILGANASGKTTALRALGFLADFATRSALYPPDTSLFFQPFWDENARKQPTVLSVEFAADWITPGQPATFRYTFSAGPSSRNSTRVIEREQLEVRSSSQWATLIDRQGASVVFKRQMAKLGGTVPQTALARSNASIVSLLRQFVPDHPIVNQIASSLDAVESNFSFWFKGRRSPQEIASIFSTDREALKALNRLIRKADLGIREVNVEEIKTSGPEQKEWILWFDHTGLSGKLADSFESHGTMNFVGLFPYIYKVLARGGLALMDELDSDLHPELLREVVGWFHDPEINQYGAQLIMTCNNPSILDSLRKEEIFFASKDDSGRTSLYALKDLPGVRRGANFQRDYLAGRYGAIPHIG